MATIKTSTDDLLLQLVLYLFRVPVLNFYLSTDPSDGTG